MATVKEICETIPQSLLDSSVDDLHLAELSTVMTEWRGLAPFLGLTPAEEEGIVVKHRDELQLQIREALRKWKEKKAVRQHIGHSLLLFVTKVE